MAYCIYTDTEPERTTPDHIIPLSLGGCNDFTVPCEPKFNSKMGETVDAKMAVDPLLMFARRDANAKGHSGKSPVPKWNKSIFNNRPSQVIMGKNKIEVWDAKSRTMVPQSEVVGRSIQSTFKIDKYTAIRFVAKVALGGACYVYGDQIRSVMDCNELRRLITFDPEKAKLDPLFLNSRVKLLDRFDDETRTNPDAKIEKLTCELSRHSIFIAIPHSAAISFSVGILGIYLGSLVIPATTSMLPNDGKHDLGHVVQMINRKIHCDSYRKFLYRHFKQMTGTDPPISP